MEITMYTLITKSESIPDNFTGVVEYSNGDKEYYVEGKRHRLDGLAIEHSNGNKEYWVEGKLHRLDGPAVDCSYGYKAYYVEGERLTEENFLARTAKSCSKDLSGLTVEVEGKKYSLKAVD
jgi:hypothetical protein